MRLSPIAEWVCCSRCWAISAGPAVFGVVFLAKFGGAEIYQRNAFCLNHYFEF
jgi:hypothetical protein